MVDGGGGRDTSLDSKGQKPRPGAQPPQLRARSRPHAIECRRAATHPLTFTTEFIVRQSMEIACKVGEQI